MAGTKINIFNLGYCATIIAFYLTPFLIVKDNIFRSDLGRDEFIKKVWEWKKESGGMITKQLRSLGASRDW